MKHLGDITRLKGSEVPVVDIVTGGSPCQDLSVAGKRAGLAGERSGLFMEQIRVIKEMRENDRRNNGRADEFLRPRYMVWENVPGAFSSNHGEDFRAVLEETAKVAKGDACIPEPPGGAWPHAGCIMGDGWSIAWRVHDAQFWGVPQRRKRIALVADFGGQSAPEILFERKSMSRDIEPSGTQGEEVAGTVGTGTSQTSAISFQERAGKPGGGKGILIQNERTGALSTLNNQSVCAFEQGAASRVGGHVYENDVAGSLRANAGDNQQAVVYGISAYESNAMKSANPNSGIYKAETARTLDLNGGSPACNQGGMAVVQGFDAYNQAMTGDVAKPLTNIATDSDHVPIVCIEGNGCRPSHPGDGWHEGDPMYTLNSTEHHAVAVENHPNDSRVKISEDGMVQTLSSRMGTGGGNVPMVMESSAWDGSQISPTLTANNAGGNQRMPDKENFNAVISFGNGQLHDALSPSNEIAKTLNCMDDPAKIVTYGLDRASYNQGKNAKFGFSIDEENSVVRRLTPLECERLQGFPDHWTDIGDWVDSKGRTHKGDADSPRYKALGNSIALPFWEWMAERMVETLKADGVENPTMASLFDGIGGFPLVYSRAGCEPVWASEIEEFPMAVTKIRFSEENEC